MSVPNYQPAWACPFRHSFVPAYSIVYIVPASNIPFSSTALSVLFGNDGANWRIAEAWLGHPGAGEPYGFDGNQVQITFDANPAITIFDTDVLSDPLTFALDSTKNLLFAVYIETYNGVPRSPCDTPDHEIYYKAGNDVATTDKTGYDGPTWPNYTVMVALTYAPTPFKLSGTIKEKGSPVVRSLRSYIRSTGVLFGSGVSLEDGTFCLSAPDDTTEMFLVAFDDDAGAQYNALIYDRVKGVVL